MRRFEMVLAAALAVAACETTAPAPPAEVQPATAAAPAPSVSAERMSEITRVLASDEFEGRSMGTRGRGEDGRLSDRAVPRCRARAGRREWRLDPDGAADPHPARRAAAGVASRQGGAAIAAALPRRRLSQHRPRDRAGADRRARRWSSSATASTAPERGWDDFKGVDLKGKVAVFLVNDPDFEAAAGEPVAGKFGGQAMTYYGRWTYKFEEAARRGAIARARSSTRRPAPAMAGTRSRRRRARITTSCCAPDARAAGAAPGLDPAAGRAEHCSGAPGSISRR